MAFRGCMCAACFFSLRFLRKRRIRSDYARWRSAPKKQSSLLWEKRKRSLIQRPFSNTGSVRWRICSLKIQGFLLKVMVPARLPLQLLGEAALNKPPFYGTDSICRTTCWDKPIFRCFLQCFLTRWQLNTVVHHLCGEAVRWGEAFISTRKRHSTRD